VRRVKSASVVFLGSVAIALLLLPAARPARGEAVWALGNHLALLDAATRTLVAPVATVAGTAEGTLSGVASNPANGTIYAIAYASDPDRTLVFRIDSSTGVATEGPTILGHRLSDIAYGANGKLYGVSTPCDFDDPAALFEINVQNGTVTKKAQLDDGGGCLSPSYGALAANPQDGDLYYASFTGDDETFVQRIALSNFAVSTVLPADDAGVFPTAMVFRPDGTALLAEQSFFSSLSLANGIADLGSASTVTAAGNVTHPAVGLSPANLACTPAPTAVCLNRGRFKVSVKYDARQTGNGQGSGKVLLESRDATKFWFFDPSNVELLVKVLDGCALNGKFWVFSAGLTNVGVELTVVDSKNSAQKVYNSPPNTTYSPKLDTGAFSCP
jgi:hypothetical protein